MAKWGGDRARVRRLVPEAQRVMTPEVVAALSNRRDDASPLVREHVAWALARHHERQPTG